MVAATGGATTFAVGFLPSGREGAIWGLDPRPGAGHGERRDAGRGGAAHVSRLRDAHHRHSHRVPGPGDEPQDQASRGKTEQTAIQRARLRLVNEGTGVAPFEVSLCALALRCRRPARTDCLDVDAPRTAELSTGASVQVPGEELATTLRGDHHAGLGHLELVARLFERDLLVEDDGPERPEVLVVQIGKQVALNRDQIGLIEQPVDRRYADVMAFGVELDGGLVPATGRCVDSLPVVKRLVPVRGDLSLLEIPEGLPVFALPALGDPCDGRCGGPEIGAASVLVDTRPRSAASEPAHDARLARHEVPSDLIGVPTLATAPPEESSEATVAGRCRLCCFDCHAGLPRRRRCGASAARRGRRI